MAGVVGALVVGGCSTEEAAKGPSDGEVRAAAAALLRGVTFDGGSIVDGSLPEENAADVKLLPLGETVLMTPGAVSIMALDVENPDEADDPIETTLVHFEKGGKHFAVTRGAADTVTGDSDIENRFQVASDVCSELCNKKYSLKLLEAPKTRSGKIGQHHTRTLELDCTESGDSSFCGDSGDGNGTVEPIDLPKTAFDGDDDLVGTWDVTLSGEDADDTLDCVVTIASGLTFAITCDEGASEYDVGCQQEVEVMEMSGSIDADTFAFTMDSMERYSGATCIDYGYTPDVDYAQMEYDGDAARTQSGPGNLGGEWDATFYEWGCPGDVDCTSDARVRDGVPVTCNFSLDAEGEISVTCDENQAPDVGVDGGVRDCDSTFVISGRISAGQLALEATEVSVGADCDTTNQPETLTVSAARR